MKTEQKIINALMELGVPCHFRGYKYIKQSITLMLQDESYIKVTKVLYPELAKRNYITKVAVERDIRIAIEYVFKIIPKEVIFKYFGNSIKGRKQTY